MSYVNGTTHYNLPQTVGTDKRDWFDTNSAFAAVDAALYAAATGQASDAEAITALQQTVAGQATDIAGLGTLTGQHTSQIAALNTTVNNLGTEVSDVRQDAEDMITAHNEGAAATSTRAYAVGDYFIYNDVLYKATAAIAIGDTIIPNTNCIATNVDTELTQVNSELSEKCIDVSDEFSISSPTPTGLKLTAVLNPVAQTVTINLFGYGSYANANIGIAYPSKYTPDGTWGDMPCGRAIVMSNGHYVDVAASFSSSGITLFYSENVSVDRLTASITYSYHLAN